ncbi:hypothetical protein HPP92_006009 [Vanilla planifolia]|uniref:Protein kinase domain-containing protein n=1 Tax=Vanilla planifolia TaxID=51239 RepID=A0A835RV23_VANPL|nr:hypothetical protein HPP92_006009 [Vanilla planifolia]
MAMVTEPLFASVANTLGNLENVITVPKELKGMEMGLLEVKHGLLQIAESLDFLHNNAHLIHRAISPETVFITSSGAWKLGGFGFAIPVDQASSGLTSALTFHYPEYDVEDSILPLQPSLNYTAPELVRSKSNTVGCAADIFSFGCLVYHLVARKPLLECRNNVKMRFMSALVNDSLQLLIDTKFIYFATLKEMVTALLNESDLFLSDDLIETIVDQVFSVLRRPGKAQEKMSHNPSQLLPSELIDRCVGSEDLGDHEGRQGASWNLRGLMSTSTWFSEDVTEYEITAEGRRITKLDQILLNGNNIAILVPAALGRLRRLSLRFAWFYQMDFMFEF